MSSGPPSPSGKATPGATATGANTFDHILVNYVGGGGVWQWKRLLYLYPSNFAASSAPLIHVLTAYVPPHRCRVPLCDDDGHSYKAAYAEWAVPEDDADDAWLSSGEDYDKCHRYDPVEYYDGGCVPANFNFSSVSTCGGHYVYDDDDFESTISTEFDLVCSNAWKRPLLDVMLMLVCMYVLLIFLKSQRCTLLSPTGSFEAVFCYL